MQHNQETSINPINTSSSKIGVEYENNFIVLDDGKHVIGVDASDANILILENVETGSSVKFCGIESSDYCITSLMYHEETGSLYSWDNRGYLRKYKIDTISKTFEMVKDYEKLNIDWIRSSHRFLDFVFFGGRNSKIRVLDLSTGELLSGCLETSIKCIYSLQVCVKSRDEIYLAVSGALADYSNDKTDLFEISGLLLYDPFILKKFLSEYSINEDDTIFLQQIIIKSLTEKNKKLTKNRDLFKAKFTEIESKHNDLKKKHDQLIKYNKELKESYKKLKTQSDIKYLQFSKKINLLYRHKSKRITIGNKMSLIGNQWLHETDPHIIIRNLKKILKEEKENYEKLEIYMYEVISQKRTIEEESKVKDYRINALQNKLITIGEVVGQR